MKKKIFILSIILILILIIFNFYKFKRKTFEDIAIFGLWADNEYVVDTRQEKVIQLDVFKTVQNSVGIHKKIAPGSYGKFTIKLIKPKNSKCKIKLKEITTKPQNLIFIVESQVYYSLEEAEEKINEIFQTKSKAEINWKWKYNTNLENDYEDTIDGENAQKYLFEVSSIVEE